MSEVYEGCLMSHVESRKIWSYHAGHQECPFDDIGYGELIFSMYVHGYGVVVTASSLPEEVKAVSRLRALVKYHFTEEIHTPSEYIRIWCGLNGGLSLSFSTVPKTWEKMKENCCIFVNIALDGQQEKCQDWGDLKEILSAAKDQGVFRRPYPLQLKPFDQNRVEALYPKADIKKYYKYMMNDGMDVLDNIHVVVKFSIKGLKTERVWLKSQQIMGNKLLTDGLLSDFSIKVGGKTFPCHKSYLAGRSVVFARMLENNMTEVENDTLEIDDMSPDGVEGLLKYVYTGELVDAVSNLRVVFEMLCAGHKYEMKDLEFVCKNTLESVESMAFDAVTAFEIYEFCGKVDGLLPLQLKAARVLKENATKFKETGEIGILIDSISSGNVQKTFGEWICDGLKHL